MRAMGRNPTEDEIMQMMNEIDIDNNVKLDFSVFNFLEYTSMGIRLQQLFHRTQRADLFLMHSPVISHC